MKNFRNTLLFSFTAIALNACTTLSGQFAASLPNQQYAPRTSADKIELFRSQTPTRKFIEIGTVNACCSQDTNQLILELQKQAAQSGGDAIIGLDVNAVGGAFASAIRYQDEK